MVSVFVALALTVTMAAIPYRWLETPFLKLKQRLRMCCRGRVDGDGAGVGRRVENGTGMLRQLRRGGFPVSYDDSDQKN